MFNKQADNAAKLAPCGSSNRSESLNQTFTSLAPKRLHLSGSESYDFRLGCGVASKNVGPHYVPEVLKIAGLSPGKHTEAYADKVARVKEKERKHRS